MGPLAFSKKIELFQLVLKFVSNKLHLKIKHSCWTECHFGKKLFNFRHNVSSKTDERRSVNVGKNKTGLKPVS